MFYQSKPQNQNHYSLLMEFLNHSKGLTYYCTDERDSKWHKGLWVYLFCYLYSRIGT